MNIISIKYFIIISIFSMSLVFAENTQLMVPTYGNDLEFSYYSQQEGSLFSSNEFKIFYSERAQKACALSENVIKTRLNSLDFWANFQNYIPRARDKWIDLDVTLLVDHFADLYPSRSSYFLENFPKAPKHIIALDCRLFSSPLLLSKLTHEMMHSFLYSYHFPIWFEEMIAQNLESDFNLEYFKNAKNYLSKKAYLPNPFKSEKPFSGSDRYALNLLMSEYLRTVFFKSNFWRVLFYSNKKLIPQSSPTNSEILTAIRRSSNVAPPWIPEFLDEKLVLKHFYLALVLNQDDNQGRGVFKIDGWQGFQSKPVEKINESMIVEPASAIRLDVKLAKELFIKNNSFKGKNIDSYLIESSFNEFRITPFDSLVETNQLIHLGKKYEVLFINWDNPLVLK